MTKRINRLKKRIAELEGVLRQLNKDGFYMSITEEVFTYLTNLLTEMKAEVAELESIEIMRDYKQIREN